MTVHVDAREAAQMVLHAKIRVPARPGPLTLVYPKWIPGDHGPTGNVADIMGLRISAGGKSLPWRRDPERTSEFAVNVPAGSNAVDVDLDVVVETRFGATAGASDLNWHRVVLYPKGARPRDLQVEARADIPPDWRYATPLSVASEGGGTLTFKPVSLEMLVDSPVILGRYGRSIDLGTALGAPHSMELVAETEDALAVNEKQIAAYRALVGEAAALFGARHYDRYTFLYLLSSAVEDGSGFEHHRSSLDVAPASIFSKEDDFRSARWLLAHEFAHSWNGKYRRPKGTPHSTTKSRCTTSCSGFTKG
ncbi:hypothetical protein [Pendulispora albinea]|uniref:Peptidase M61 domain-containing protein n=1 Tax=Pendulispora albinea TaxID=2741071 RepID=A0ABZ2MBG0_9BACT